MAEAAAAIGAHIVYVSTDYVFDGDAERPLRRVGRTGTPFGLRPQQARRRAGDPHHLRVRRAPSCARPGSAAPTAPTWSRRPCGWPPPRPTASSGSSTTSTAAPPSPPTWPGPSSGLGTDRRPGTFHVTNQGETTWFGFVQARSCRPPATTPPGWSRSDRRSRPAPDPAPRPANSRLDNAALRLSGLPAMPRWEDALGRLWPHCLIRGDRPSSGAGVRRGPTHVRR